MHRVISKWRLLVPVVALIAVAAFFLSGSLTSHDAAEASPGDYDTSSITCTDVYLGVLQEPQPWAPKDPLLGDPPTIDWRTANSISYTDHLGDNTLGGSGATYTIGIPGVIAGSLEAFVNCAEIVKAVATVSGSSGTDPVTVTYTDDDGANPLAANMLVYSTHAATAGEWFQVDTAAAGTAVLKPTVATCNNTAIASTAGKLWACEGMSPGKGWDVLAYTNPDVTTGDIIKPGVQPRDLGAGKYNCPTCGHYFEKGTNMTVDISCTPGTGPSEDPGDPIGEWTRIEIYVLSDTSVNSKVPSWGLSQYYNPVEPKTCDNMAGTERSNIPLVVWALDSAEVEGDISNWDSDWDGDGCLDWEELNYPKPTYHTTGTGNWTGGRDPVNPFDCGRNLTGIWSITVTAIEMTMGANKAGYTNIIPGAFFGCRAGIDHDKGTNDIDAAVFCYIDSALLEVNPEGAPGVTGDGLGGYVWPIGATGMPPPPYADVDDVQTHLTGAYDDVNDEMNLTGCFEDRDGQSALGHVYVDANNINILTGNGSVDIYTGQTLANCLAGTPVEPPTFPDANLQAGIQAGKEGGAVLDTQYDYDLDRCPDKNELSDNQQQGGLRDPSNQWDYMNPTMDGQNRVDDILATVNQYFIDLGNPSYTTETDRTAVIGANPWNLGPPNGQQRVDDILASVKSYFHDCSIP